LVAARPSFQNSPASPLITRGSLGRTEEGWTLAGNRSHYTH